MNKLIISPVNGLINRFRAMASASILAEYTGRELYVNWVPEYVCNVNLFDLIESDSLNEYKLPINIYDNCYFHHGPTKCAEQPFVSEMINTNAEILYLVAGGNFNPNDMSANVYNDKKSKFYKSIKFRSIITDRVNEFIYKNPEYTGVHLRYTDRSNWSPSIDYVSNLIKNIDGKVFICTDDKTVLNYLLYRYPEKIIHYNITNLDRNSKEGSIQSMIDWLILCNSKKIYYSMGSSYSFEACLYNKLYNSEVMNPNNLILDYHQVGF